MTVAALFSAGYFLCNFKCLVMINPYKISGIWADLREEGTINPPSLKQQLADALSIREGFKKIFLKNCGKFHYRGGGKQGGVSNNQQMLFP